MDQTQDITELKARLIMLGAEEGELDQVIDDVNGVIAQRAIQEYLTHLNNPEVNKTIEHMSGEELVEYFTKNASQFPPLSEKRVKEIAEETWKDYFEFMDSR